jgi:hypothetical protein
VKLFVKSDMGGVLVLALFLRRFAWWVVLGSKPMDLLKFLLNPITFINRMINDIGFKPTINIINFI